MKKGFFLLASLATLFSSESRQGQSNVKEANNFLKNCNPISGGGGKPSKHVWEVMDKKRKKRNNKNRVAGRSRNINHRKAA